MNNINLRARYILSAASVWVDKLSRHLDSDERRLDPVLFPGLYARLRRHSIDRFTSTLNTILPRCNAGWRDPTCEAVSALHLSDDNWCKESNWCSPTWSL
jgi:hypothetical protein